MKPSQIAKTQTIQMPHWQRELERWFKPFGQALAYKTREVWGPLYLQGLLGPAERKSVEAMAPTVAPDDAGQLHHFIATSHWELPPLERELARKGQRLAGGASAVMIVDDTPVLKKGTHSPGVAPQYCGQLGKIANCQTLVSLTLARDEVPVPLALRLYVPKEWTDDPVRCEKAGIPEAYCRYRPKWQIALEELDRLRESGVTFSDVLADAAYGKVAEFRASVRARGYHFAVGMMPAQQVYPAHVKTRKVRPATRMGRPFKHPRPTLPSRSAQQMMVRYGRFRRLSWREGTKGALSAEFAAVRVRVADGALFSAGQHLPGEALWLVCERRETGEEKYYLTSHSPHASLKRLARAIKARWVCEQAHQQLKEELGLDHFEGRSWLGLHHHALFTMIAMAFLQHLRLKQVRRGKKTSTVSRATAAAELARGAPCAPRSTLRPRSTLSAMSYPSALQSA
jgi:SRSO17 transposase